MAGNGRTIVEGRMMPRHFKFAPVVQKEGPGAGGWSAACVHLRLQHDMGPAYLCMFGVEVPLETGAAGPISVTRAQRVAAKCANMAADIALGATTAQTPLGIACTSFIGTFRALLQRDLLGTRVTTYCRDEPKPVDAP
jgi:hypothetical protein